MQKTFQREENLCLQYNGWNGEEFARRSELDAVVHLFPVCEEPSFALVWGFEGGPLHCV